MTQDQTSDPTAAPTPGGEPRTPSPAGSIFDRLGTDAFWRIARAFYARIDADPQLRSMFPDDLEEPIRNQAEFLIQFFGGPGDYSARKGHPRLRARHLPFAIDQAARNRWVGHMAAALEVAAIPADIRPEMMGYFERTATFMINRGNQGGPPAIGVPLGRPH